MRKHRRMDFGPRWDRLAPDVLYVLELIQFNDGQRQTRLRPLQAEAGYIENGKVVFETEPHCGRDLESWANDLQLAEIVRLSNGERFVLEAHGGWLTWEEFDYRRASPENKRGWLAEKGSPWVNDLPPVVPEK